MSSSRHLSASSSSDASSDDEVVSGKEQMRAAEKGKVHQAEDEHNKADKVVDIDQKKGREPDEEEDEEEKSSSSSSSSPGFVHDDELGDEELGVVSKYAKVNQPCPFSKRSPPYPVLLEWRNINYKVVLQLPPDNFFLKLLLRGPLPDRVASLLKKKREVPILNNVSGFVNPGNIIAIMGPTGSGKTTLLNVLARRIKRNVTGDILVNGEEVHGSRLKRRMAYVLQDDLFFPNLTVRETVNYTAYLKLPTNLSLQEKRDRVDEILSEVGLTRAANTIVGGMWVRGISGGERKRTNIANELINNPSLIFLDEPTTGLDAATSLGLIVSLKQLAKSGHTVVTTIHQPSSAMFMMFDNVLLLAEGGWVVYSGSAAGVLPYFASLGLHAPTHYNPADFMLEVVTCNEKMNDGRTVRQLLIDSYGQREKDDGPTKPVKITDEFKAGAMDIKKGPKYPTNFFLQTGVMAMRTFKQRRHEILSWAHVIQVSLISILSAFLWFQTPLKESAINDRVGFLFFSTMFWTMHTWFQALYAFPPERAVLNRERATGTFRLSAYFVGKTIAEAPLEMVLPLLFGVITYWIVGLPGGGNFIFFLVLLCLYTLMGAGIGLAIGAAVVQMKKALTISIIIVLSSVLLGGFFLKSSTLPVWIAWARWLSVIKYSYEVQMLNQFQLTSVTFTPSSPSSYSVNPITGSAILHYYDIETNVWGDIIFLVGMIILSRICAYLALRFLNKPRM
jgi:ATP-binding cassette subfamily G (WHITE) protein 2